MSKKFVVDSCVFAKLFLNESDRSKAIKFFNEILENRYQIFVPSIFTYEIFNICSSQNLDEELVFSMLGKYHAYGMQIVNPSESLLRKAIKMTKNGSRKSGYPSLYDCSYHALAIDLDCQFITSDLKHISKAREFGSIKSLDEIYDE